MSLSPSSLWTVAPTGQTSSHGAFSHCMHGTGWKYVSRIVEVALVVAVDAHPVHLPAARHLSLPTTGMLFSAWQATTQALQPMQDVRSMAMPQRLRGV